jgi:hypothetical protein
MLKRAWFSENMERKRRKMCKINKRFVRRSSTDRIVRAGVAGLAVPGVTADLGRLGDGRVEAHEVETPPALITPGYT